MSDLRLALRTFSRNAGFTAVVVLTLAIGIGATTAIFSVASGVMLRPLPFADPDRLVQIAATGEDGNAIPFPDIAEFRIQSTAVVDIAGYGVGVRTLQDLAPEPERVVTISTERPLFDVLGAQPMLGRTFLANDPPDVVVIGEGFWERHFDRDASAAGRTITLEDLRYTVIGVMPDEFQFPYRAGMLAGAAAGLRTELWIPFNFPPNLDRRGRAEFVVARLIPGMTLDAANGELNTIAARLAGQFPATNRGRGVQLTPLADVVAGPARNALLILLGAAGLVLLLSCANIANLLLARMVARRHEVAVRAALGAGRGSLARQFLIESLVLAAAGGLLGLAISVWATDAILASAATRIPRSWEIGLDWRVFGFLAAVCATTGAAFGVVPALTAARANAREALGEFSGRTSAGVRHGRLRDSLVVAEVALAFVLVLAGSLMIRSLLLLQQTDTGMVPANVLTLHLTSRATAADYTEVQRRVEQVPGVRAAGLIQLLPLQNWGWNGFLTIEAPRPGEPTGKSLVELRYVTPGYFRALGIPFRSGRGFTDADTSETPRVILVNEALARQYFPTGDPINRVTDRGTIVGVVGDVRHVGLDQPAIPEVYYPIAQNVAARSDTGMSLVVSTRVPPESLAGPVRGAVSAVIPNQAVFQVQTMEQVIAESLSDLRLYSSLIGLFGGVALLLAVAGIYGVMSHAVASRTREIGIRVALGAQRSGVMGLVLRHGGRLIVIGLAIGLWGAFMLAPALQALPVTVPPLDTTTAAAVGAVLAVAGFMACALPARRAARVPPMSCLKADS